jgi:cobalt/nickel transport system permease protein
MGAVSAGALGVALRRCRRMLDDKAEALLGVCAAGVFAAQMVNFPIPGGTSGHLVGGALSGIVLGPWAGLVAVSCVLIVQCFLFADGGLIALGANVFNMGVVGSLSGSAIHSLLRPLAGTSTSRSVAAGIAAWCATVLAAAACTFELCLSGGFGLPRTLSVMVGFHAIIGVGEAIITALVVRALLQRSRSGVECYEPAALSPKSILAGGLALAATVVVVLAPFSSVLPDGLDRSLSTLGAEKPETTAWSWQFPEYEIPGLGIWSGTIAAGLTGIALVFVLVIAAFRFAAMKTSTNPQNL